MVSRTGGSVAAGALACALLVGVITPAVAGPAPAGPAPAGPTQTGEGVPAALAPAPAVRVLQATVEPPDGTLVELDVVVPEVTGGEVTESAELTEALADDEVVAAAEVVAPDRVASEVVDTADVQTIGLTWPTDADGAALEPEVRVQTDGEWSPWQPIGEDEEAPDAGTADADNAAARGGTEAVWIGDAEAVQLSFSADVAQPEDMSLVLVGSEEVPLPADDALVGEVTVDATSASLVTGSLAAATPALTVIPRSGWGARDQVCTPDVASALVGAVVHHTAGANGYQTQAQAMQQIRNDQRYHIEGRQWCDLGYNFVVDKWGNIYEGRANSLTKAVIGVHAGGFNTGTVGVSMLGTYDAAPSAATQQSVGQIIGYRLAAYGVNPRGSMSYTTGSGENSKFRNTTVTLPRVFGHRDVAYTACPGNGGYAALGNIRAIAESFGYGQRFGYARAVVRALYADFLNRGPDPTGMAYWSGLLAGGSGGPALVSGLTNSDEYVNQRIRQAYTQTLGRQPEPGGMEHWYREIRAGRATVDDVTRHFLSSAEFHRKSGGTDAGYVRRLYETVLGRRASNAEVANWTTQIARHGREAVADAIWFSMEAAEVRAGTYYRMFLKRNPEPGGATHWARVLLTQGEGAVRAGIAGSDEYARKAQVRYPN